VSDVRGGEVVVARRDGLLVLQPGPGRRHAGEATGMKDYVQTVIELFLWPAPHVPGENPVQAERVTAAQRLRQQARLPAGGRPT
jgi:hypothetical protein